MWRRVIAVFLTLVAILAAGWLALRRGDIPYDTLELAYTLPSSEFVTLDNGMKLHFTDTGPRDHPVIVLVHGFSASLHTWKAWKEDLEEDYRVITLDLPGHGLSRAEAPELATMERFSEMVLGLTDLLDVKRFTLVGSSMGGAVSWTTALQAPERVQGLVLIGAAGWRDRSEDDGDRPFALTLMQNPVARYLLKDLDMTRMYRSGLEETYVDTSYVTDDLVDRYVSLSRAPGHRETLLSLLSRDDPGLKAEDLAPLDMPVLILWGRQDNLVPVAHADLFAEALPQAETVIYDDVGHLPHEEAAARSLEEMREFMLTVELSALDEEFVEPAGDPRLVEDRPTTSGGR